MSCFVSRLLLFVSAVAAQQATTTTFSPRSLASTPLITGSAIIVPAPAYPNGFAASIISGDACTAAYALTCTDAGLCFSSGNSFTATRAPTSYQYVESGIVASPTPFTYTRLVRCTYSISALPTCAVTIAVTVSANSSTTVTTETDNARITYVTAAITAGASLPSGACQGTTYQYQSLVVTTSSTGTVTTQTQTATPAPPSSASSTNVGAIAGGVVGGVVLIAIIVAVIFMVMRKRRQMKPTLPEMQRYPNGQ